MRPPPGCLPPGRPTTAFGLRSPHCGICTRHRSRRKPNGSWPKSTSAAAGSPQQAAHRFVDGEVRPARARPSNRERARRWPLPRVRRHPARAGRCRGHRPRRVRPGPARGLLPVDSAVASPAPRALSRLTAPGRGVQSNRRTVLVIARFAAAVCAEVSFFLFGRSRAPDTGSASIAICMFPRLCRSCPGAT